MATHKAYDKVIYFNKENTTNRYKEEAAAYTKSDLAKDIDINNIKEENVSDELLEITKRIITVAGKDFIPYALSGELYSVYEEGSGYEPIGYVDDDYVLDADDYAYKLKEACVEMISDNHLYIDIVHAEFCHDYEDGYAEAYRTIESYENFLGWDAIEDYCDEDEDPDEIEEFFKENELYEYPLEEIEKLCKEFINELYGIEEFYNKIEERWNEEYD